MRSHVENESYHELEAWITLAKGSPGYQKGGTPSDHSAAAGDLEENSSHHITLEKNKKHLEIVKKNLKLSQFSDQVELRNEELNDQTEIISCNSIILDLPDPQELVKWAEKSLVLGGKLLCYVPTINQVESLLGSLNGWSEIEINEMMHRTWQSRLEAIRPNTNILGHTGFIVSARLLNK